jgi:Domain of unknown function (DUF1707)
MQHDQTETPRDPRPRGGARNMRASDADRDAMAEVLRRHYAEGRLDSEEFDERIGRCYTAKRLSELDDLLADLPREEPKRPDSGPEHDWRGRWPAGWPVMIVPLIIALIAICALTGAHLFWLAIPLFFFFGPFGRFRCGRRPGYERRV